MPALKQKNTGKGNVTLLKEYKTTDNSWGKR